MTVVGTFDVSKLFGKDKLVQRIQTSRRFWAFRQTFQRRRNMERDMKPWAHRDKKQKGRICVSLCNS